jgi:DNA-directed RNA polymerase specialized sigma subunit
MGSLSPESRDLLWRYVIEEKTHAELGEELGCSQIEVSRQRARIAGS